LLLYDVKSEIVNLVHIFDKHYYWDNLNYLSVSFPKSKGLYLERRIDIIQTQIRDKGGHDIIELVQELNF